MVVTVYRTSDEYAFRAYDLTTCEDLRVAVTTKARAQSLSLHACCVCGGRVSGGLTDARPAVCLSVCQTLRKWLQDEERKDMFAAIVVKRRKLKDALKTLQLATRPGATVSPERVEEAQVSNETGSGRHEGREAPSKSADDTCGLLWRAVLLLQSFLRSVGGKEAHEASLMEEEKMVAHNFEPILLQPRSDPSLPLPPAVRHSASDGHHACAGPQASTSSLLLLSVAGTSPRCCGGWWTASRCTSARATTNECWCWPTRSTDCSRTPAPPRYR